MNVRWTLAAAALAIAACSTTSSSGRGGTAANANAEPKDDEMVAADTADMNQAAEQAPSARPSEGAGGKNPHPLPTDREGGQPSYAGVPDAPRPSLEGRTPDTEAYRKDGVSGGDSVQGKVAAIDAANRELAIDAGSATTQVRVADDAKITVDGKQSSFEDLKQGAEVRVSLDKSGDVPQATEIEVQPSK